MAQIPDRVQEIVERLKQGKQPNRQSTRKILKWFGAVRRGDRITVEIRDAFRLVGLRTDPDFIGANIDEPLKFLLVEGQSAQDPAADLPEARRADEPPGEEPKPVPNLMGIWTSLKENPKRMRRPQVNRLKKR